MAIKYSQGKPSKFATVNDEDSLTEQEHKESCDINKMLKAAARGQAIMTNGRSGIFWKDGGYDDLTKSGLDHRIQKQKIEEDLSKLKKDHFTEEELKAIPLNIIKKFGFVPKKAEKREKSNNAIKQPINDEDQNPSSPTTPAPKGAPKAD